MGVLSCIFVVFWKHEDRQTKNQFLSENQLTIQNPAESAPETPSETSMGI